MENNKKKQNQLDQLDDFNKFFDEPENIQIKVQKFNIQENKRENDNKIQEEKKPEEIKQNNFNSLNTKKDVKRPSFDPDSFSHINKGYEVPIIPDKYKKKQNKKFIQVYIDKDIEPILAKFIKKNNLGKSEAINYVIRDFFDRHSRK